MTYTDNGNPLNLVGEALRLVLCVFLCHDAEGGFERFVCMLLELVGCEC